MYIQKTSPLSPDSMLKLPCCPMSTWAALLCAGSADGLLIRSFPKERVIVASVFRMEDILCHGAWAIQVRKEDRGNGIRP